MTSYFNYIFNSIKKFDQRAKELNEILLHNKQLGEEKIRLAKEMITDQAALADFIAFEQKRTEENEEMANRELQTIRETDPEFNEFKKITKDMIIYLHMDESRYRTYDPERLVGQYGFCVGAIRYTPAISPTFIFPESEMIRQKDYRIPYCYEDECENIYLFTECAQENTKEASGLFGDIVHRWLYDSPMRQAQAVIIDPVNRGAYLGTTMNMIGDNDLDVCTYYKNEDEINQIIAKLTEHVDFVLAELTKVGEEDLFDYNAWACEEGEKTIPYKTLVINDFPCGFKPEALSNLEIILNNANVCGINVLISHKSKDKMSISSYDDKAQKIYDEYLSEFTKVEISDKGATLTCEKGTFPFERIPVNVDIEYINAFREAYGKKPTIQNDFASTIQSNDIQRIRKQTGDCVNSLSIPFAVDEKGEVLSLEMDSDNATFGLITGGTGSGKTTLLHTLITSAVMHYSPKELQLWLIDYKNIEFRSYAKTCNAPHIRYVIADDSNEISYDFIRLLKQEFKRRKSLFNEVGVTSFRSYRKTGRELPRLLIVIDESHRLAQAAQEDGNCQKDIHDLFAEVRSTGINILLCDQHKSSAMKGFTPETEKAISVRVAMRNDKADIQETLNLEYKDLNADEALKQTVEDISIAKQGMLIYRKEVAVDGDTNKKQFISARAIYMSEEEKIKAFSDVKATDSEYPALMDYYLGEGRMPLDLKRIQDFEKNDPPEYGRDRFYIGTPNGIQYGFYLNLDNALGENILLAGSDLGLKVAIVKSVIESAVRNGYKIVLLGWIKTQFYKQFPELFVNDNARNIQSYTKRGDICKYICQSVIRLENLINADDDDDDEMEEDQKTLVIIPGMEELWKKLEVLSKTRRDVLSDYDETPSEVANIQDSQPSKDDIMAQFAGGDDRMRMLLQMGMEAGLADEEDANGLLSSDGRDALGVRTETDAQSGAEAAKSEDKVPAYNATKDLEQLISKGYANNLHMLCLVDSGMFVKQQRTFESGFNHRIAVPNVGEPSAVLVHDRVLTKLVDDRVTTDAVYEYMRGRAQIFKPYEY